MPSRHRVPIVIVTATFTALVGLTLAASPDAAAAKLPTCTKARVGRTAVSGGSPVSCTKVGSVYRWVASTPAPTSAPPPPPPTAPPPPPRKLTLDDFVSLGMNDAGTRPIDLSATASRADLGVPKLCAGLAAGTTNSGDAAQYIGNGTVTGIGQYLYVKAQFADDAAARAHLDHQVSQKPPCAWSRTLGARTLDYQLLSSAPLAAGEGGVQYSYTFTNQQLFNVTGFQYRAGRDVIVVEVTTSKPDPTIPDRLMKASLSGPAQPASSTPVLAPTIAGTFDPCFTSDDEASRFFGRAVRRTDVKSTEFVTCTYQSDVASIGMVVVITRDTKLYSDTAGAPASCPTKLPGDICVGSAGTGSNAVTAQRRGRSIGLIVTNSPLDPATTAGIIDAIGARL